MNKSVLIVTSVGNCTSAQETLRVQDTVAALRKNGWAVDVLTPVASPILAATLAHDVRVYTIPRIPFMRRLLMFLRGVALASGREYKVLHGIDEGVGIARAIDRVTFRRFAYIAEAHHPETIDRHSLRHASAVIVPSEESLLRFVERPPVARVSVLPDPHAELVDNAFTAAEFAAAIDGIYTYVLRTHPEMQQ